MSKSEKVFNPKTGTYENCNVGLGCQKHNHAPQQSLNAFKDNLDSISNELEDRTPSELVDSMLQLIDESQAGWQRTYDKVVEIHNDTTAKLANLHQFSLEEYDAWLAHSKVNPDKSMMFEATSVNGIIDSARFSTWEGHLVQVNAESDDSGPFTEVTYYIGENPFKTISINKHFNSSNPIELHEAVDMNKPF